ncbi:TPA: hypothetical protein ACNKKJ_000989 [Enterococcus faecalis]|uniref:hypothetical protein n=1 Tax=Enterococcus faecalis TaxID=1351 RepID=UPI0019E582AF|nr:hypothetical protein [Enterococcus faecalis]EGO8956831.1 hypothetical protein [Enterococcus faecalis]EGO9237196.1 hypothetical protein [Enterococcus faecalis]EHE8504417.1 hypothetical protein [Enterococcus faecalis]EHZ9257650.1 hypothetical protein [Enterococcus faecalis]
MSKINFGDYNFEVISVETTGSYLLTLNKNSLTFDKSIAEALGYTSHVKPLLDRENKVFAIQACKANSLKSIPFSKPESQQKGSIKMQYGAIRNILRSLMGDKWKEEMRYQFKGDLIPDKKAMIFELEKFEELSPFIPRNIK